MGNTLSELTTFGIGGSVKSVKLATSRESLIDFAQDGVVLGRGSNILASDYGYDGNIVVNRYESISIESGVVKVGSGTRLTALCGYLAENGLSGMEWAVGIPGTVGGAVRMNAGAFLGSLSDVLLYAEVLRNGKVVTLPKSELGFSYRSSSIESGDTVISAGFAFTPCEPAVVKKRNERYGVLRKNSQPTGRSAGSIFKNPQGISVGKIFDEAGLKGLRHGGAVISQRHANIIVNTGGATARDVVALIRIMRGVLTDNGVKAEEEIIYLGDF